MSKDDDTMAVKRCESMTPGAADHCYSCGDECRCRACGTLRVTYGAVETPMRTTLVCAQCGACAEHPEDRKDGRCQACGATPTRPFTRP